MISMILLYGASSAYHAFDISEKANRILKKIDHISVCILIAGTYTPVCAIALRQQHGLALFIAIWLFALGGSILKLFWINW